MTEAKHSTPSAINRKSPRRQHFLQHHLPQRPWRDHVPQQKQKRNVHRKGHEEPRPVLSPKHAIHPPFHQRHLAVNLARRHQNQIRQSSHHNIRQRIEHCVYVTACSQRGCKRRQTQLYFVGRICRAMSDGEWCSSRKMTHLYIIFKRNCNLPYAVLSREVPESLRDLRRSKDFQWIKGLDFTLTVKPHKVLQQPVIALSISLEFHLHSVKPVSGPGLKLTLPR